MSLLLFWIGTFLLFIVLGIAAFFTFAKELRGNKIPMYFYFIPTIFFIAAATARYLGI